MIKSQKSFFENLSAGFDGVFDWDFLLPAFEGTKIEPMDIDAAVERHGKVLLIETKSPGKAIPLGQEITLKTLLGIGKGSICVMVIYGKAAQSIVAFEEWHWHNGVIEVKKTQCESSYVLKRVTEWFRWANASPNYLMPNSIEPSMIESMADDR